MKKKTASPIKRTRVVCYLAKFREKKGLTRQGLCDLIGIKRETELRALEDYGRVPRVMKAIAIADAVGVKDLREIWKEELIED